MTASAQAPRPTSAGRRVTSALLVAICTTSLLDGWQARDPGPGPARSAAGTASIAGVVTAADGSAAPIRRAIVSISGGPLAAVRSAVTNDEGRFLLSDLPAGRFTVIATKAAYLDASYGASRPGRPGTPVSLASGERRALVIHMTRGAVIEGVIRDEFGIPLPGLTVQALPPGQSAVATSTFGRNQVTSVTTDDRGAYRLFGLPPGEYVIAAVPTLFGDGEIGRRQEADTNALLSRLRDRTQPGRAASPAAPEPASEIVAYAPSYFPGVATASAATRVRLAAAEERRGTDFVFAPIAVGTIEGSVVRADGQTLDNVMLSVDVGSSQAVNPASRMILTQPPGPDGRFRYSSVAPGRYRLVARAGVTAPDQAGRGGAGGRGGASMFVTSGSPTGTAPANPSAVFAVADVDITGPGVATVALTLRPGVSMRGRVVFDAAAATPPDPSALRIGLSAPGTTGSYSASYLDGTRFGNVLGGVSAVNPRPDGSFELAGIPPGTYAATGFLPAGATSTWWLRSATYGDRDMLDSPMVIREQDVDGVVLTYTDRRNELSGSLATAQGQPAPDYFVVVLPADATLWQPGSRRLKSTRPATDGTFSIRDLPAGTYLLAALTDFEPRDFEDRDFLTAVAAPGQALAVTIRDGERIVQDIRIRN